MQKGRRRGGLFVSVHGLKPAGNRLNSSHNGDHQDRTSPREGSMRIGLAALARGIVAALALNATADAATYVYVGNAGSSEIVVLSLNPKNGELTEVEKITVPGITKAGGSTPLAISPNKKFLYAGFRGEPLAAATFAIDSKTGKLKHLGNATLADSMAYIVTDRTGKWLLSASYPGHKISVNPIGPDGIVQAPKQVLPTPPNAHSILTDKSNRHLLVPTLGADVVNQFKFDPASGTISPNDPPKVSTAEKSGPRHFRFSNNEKFVYLLCEVDATLYVFPYDAKAGTLGKAAQVVSVMPPGAQVKPWAADVHLTPNGKFLYASERTTSTISAYKVDAASGVLTPIGTVPTEQQPRAFNIDSAGKYLYAVGEKSDGMTSYAIDGASGKLTKLKQYPMGKSPNWVEIVDLP
jgi:6-phosphogluconolactonase